jgi:hypothetical protein
MTEENDILEPQTIPRFEQAGFQLPDFETEPYSEYIDLSDEYFELIYPPFSCDSGQVPSY